MRGVRSLLGAMIYAFSILVRKNIKISVKEIRLENTEWINFA
jgi:hypothetical protein